MKTVNSISALKAQIMNRQYIDFSMVSPFGVTKCKFRSNGVLVPKLAVYLFRYNGVSFPSQRCAPYLIIMV
ncbi:hypothetical protein [uncultured Robinsoniella sp.]|uniref:hypothetical protein n=1 Tax=uncultured Robinsoniella sp. TaxID=904190 RepID=UPI00374E9BF3